MQASTYQTAIWDHIAQRRGNLIVEAVAGSGKTTTIHEAVKQRPTDRVMYLVFNKRNADEAGQKLGSENVATFNSYGHRICLSRGMKFDKWKTWNLNDDLKIPAKVYLKNITSLLKAHCCYSPDDDLLAQIVEKYALDAPPDDLWDRYLRIIDNDRLFDFDDQIFIPARSAQQIGAFDVVYVDECQDLNPIKIAFLSLIEGMKVCVGDTHQAIYGFSGADVEAMKSLRTRFACSELPLSINYRCGKSIIEEAKHYVPHIEAWENSPMGTVTTEKFDNIGPGEYVLCRNTAPLVKLCLTMLTQGKPASILGREALEGITRIMDRVPFDGLTAWYEAESARLAESGRTTRLTVLEENYDTLDALSEGCKSWQDVRRKIDTIFQDRESRGITLMTIHKSKGLEARTVRLMNHWKCRATEEWQAVQEDNLRYVAVTRAKENLIYEKV